MATTMRAAVFGGKGKITVRAADDEATAATRVRARAYA
jgi:hypothetical protein